MPLLYSCAKHRVATVGSDPIASVGRLSRREMDQLFELGVLDPYGLGRDLFNRPLGTAIPQLIAGSSAGLPKLVSRKSKSQPSLACLMWRENIQP